MDREVERQSDHWVVRSPGNPTHYWGNFLVFDAVPAAGEADRWESCFTAAFGSDPAVRHRSFAWDRTDGERGAAAEFTGRGYRLETTIALIAGRAAVHGHPRASSEVQVRGLDPDPGGDPHLWDQVLELQVRVRSPDVEEADHRRFCRARLDDLRTLFRQGGRGRWWVALDGREVVGSLGVVVTGGRARYQSVDTAETHRRRGVCTRLVTEAARRTAQEHAVEQFVICADAAYHALGIYESVGFVRAETVHGLLLPPRGG